MTEQTEQPAHQHVEDERVINATPAIDGASTLAEAASLAHGYAAELKRLHDEGFVLRDPVLDGQAVAYRPEGENPNLIGEHQHEHGSTIGHQEHAYDGLI